MEESNPKCRPYVLTLLVKATANQYLFFLPVSLRACWEFVFGDKKDVFFILMRSNFFVIAVAIANKFDEIRTKKTLF